MGLYEIGGYSTRKGGHAHEEEILCSIAGASQPPHDLPKAQLGMEKSLGLRSLINSVRV